MDGSKNGSAEQIVVKLRRIGVQMAQSRSIDPPCNEAENSERSFRTGS